MSWIEPRSKRLISWGEMEVERGEWRREESKKAEYVV